MSAIATLLKPVEAEDSIISARYWRMLAVNISWSDYYTEYVSIVYELQLFSTEDCSGTRIPKSAADASSVYNVGYPGNAFDGNVNTLWSSARDASEYQWLSMDAGEAVVVASIAFRGYAYASHGLYPKRFALQYSNNNVDWNTLAELDTIDTTTATWQYFQNLQTVG